MRCSNCGNEIPDGSLFCIRCGTKLEESGKETNKKERKKKEPKVKEPKVKEPKVKEPKVKEPKAKKEKEPGKKKHTGLKIFLVLIILLLIIAAGAVASWIYVIPQPVKEYVFLNKDLMQGNYEAVPGYFEFSNPAIAEDSAGFTAFAKEHFAGGIGFADLKDLYGQKFFLKNTAGSTYELKYDDQNQRFKGDMFTYSFVIEEPALVYPDEEPDSANSRYIKRQMYGFMTDSVDHECNVTLGNDKTESTNTLKLTIGLENGKISDVLSCSIDNDKYDAKDFYKIKGNSVFINALVVDEAYARDVCSTYAAFTGDLVKNACDGVKFDDFVSKYEGKFIPELYKDDYEYYYVDRDFYDMYEYVLSLKFDKLHDLPLFDVDSNSLVIGGFYKGTIKTIMDDEVIDQDSYILIRPYDSKDCFVMNSSMKEDVSVLGDKLDEGLSYEDAMTQAYLALYSETENAITPAEINELVTAAVSNLTSDEKEAYLDALSDYERQPGHIASPRFTFVDINSDYPLMICTDGDEHECTSHIYQYDGKTKRVYDLGECGEYGELLIDTKEGIIATYTGNMGYYMLDYYFIYNTEVNHEVELTVDDRDRKTVYTSKGEEIKESEFNEIVDDYEKAYPESEMLKLTYADAYDITDDNLKNILF
ncbi:MAG: zinc ribbon domain-containing protein [Lachnospiraceae bacterium]|nr:zinc ribbon domain-containing protein [Lachnospiraceae bacterium]